LRQPAIYLFQIGCASPMGEPIPPSSQPHPGVRTTAAPDATLTARYRTEGLWATTTTDLVADAAIRTPMHRALIARDGRLTYAELHRAVGEATQCLTTAGVGVGDAVLLVSENDVASATAFHAIRRAGATAVMVQATAGPADIGFALRMTAPRVAIGPGESLEVLTSSHSSVHWLAVDRLTDTARLTEPLGSPDDPALVVFTSGTTARPKGVIHSANTLGIAARNYIGAADLTGDDRFFLVSPLASITGVLQALVMAPMLGATVVLERHWDEVATLDLLLAEEATFYGGPDVIVERLLGAATRAGLDRLPIRAVSLGGTMLDQRLLARAEDEFGIKVMRAYGSSEAPFSTATLHDAPRMVRLEDDGQPLDGVEVRIGSSDDPGECLVRGPHLFLGYLDARENIAAFEDGWYRTGDVATLVGAQLKVTGRIKEIVIRNGMKISMTEVEEAAANIPGVDTCVVFKVLDDETGEHLGIAVCGDGELTLAAINAALSAQGLAKWKLPEELVHWPGDLPRTTTGKIKREDVGTGARSLPRQSAERLRPR